MRNLVNEVSNNEALPIEDRNSPSAKGGDLDSRSLSESIKKGDGYVIFSPEGPEVGGTRIILKWGGNPPEENKQQKDEVGKGKDQDKDKERGDKGDKGDKGEEAGEGKGEQDKGGQGGTGSEGTGEAEGDEKGGKDKGKQSDQKGGRDKGKGKDEGGDGGEEEGGETEGDGKGGEKGGKEKDGESGKGQGGKGQGGQGGDVGDEDEGEGDGGDERGGLDPDKIRGQDILGRGRNRGEEPDDGDDGKPRRPPHGPRKKGKGKDKGKSSDKSRRPGEPGEPVDPEDDDTVVEVSSDITDVPPPSEEEDPRVLDVIFDKDKKEVSQKENKVIHKSFVFRSGKESVQVFQITPKGRFSAGDRKHIKKLANLVYYLYEPFLKAPDVDLDPSVPVISSPISSRGLRSDQPYERPKISYGALSTLDRVDFSKLIVFIDVSGSMDMVMVSRAINSYFQSVFTALRKNQGKLVKVVVILHGTNAGVFGITSPWVTAAQTIAGVAESSRDLVGMMNGSESTLTHRIVDILRTVSPIQGINDFINGPVPLIWITDFYWVISPGNQLSQFLRQKPALLISTVGDPEDVAKGLGDKTDETFSGGAFGTARTIMSKVPYGALIYFPSFVGASSGSFTPGSSSGGSTVRVYAKGGAYDQLLSRKDKLGQVSIVRIR
jgi:hypothetical protein